MALLFRCLSLPSFLQMFGPPMERKKVLIIVPAQVPGGSERFVSILFNKLSRVRFDVRLIVLKSDVRAYELLYPEDITYYNTKNVRSSIGVVLKEIRKQQPDVVFSTITSLNILLSFIRFFYPFFSLIIRESTILSHYYKNNPRKFLYETPVKIFYRFADKIICQSKAMMNDLLTNYRAAKSKMHVINNPVLVENFPLRSQRAPGSKIRLLTIARLDPPKGFDRILRSLAKLKTDFEYTIVGDFSDPMLRPQFDALVTKHKLGDKIVLAGTTRDPHEYLRKADVYVHGSYFEGFPNVLLEAGATGLPAVSFNTMGAGEIMIDGVNGFVVEDNDEDAFAKAIEDAANHPFDSGQIRQLTQERFDDKVIVAKYESVIESVARTRGIVDLVPGFLKNKEVLVNTSHNYLNKALNALTPVFLIPYFNKMFGVSQYGVLIYIQAIATLLIYISDFGFVYTGTREVSLNANSTERLSSLVSSVMVVKLILTLIIFACMFLLFYIRDVPESTVVLYSLTFLSLTLSNFMPGWFFQGMKKNSVITIANVISKLLLIGLVIAFVQPGSPLWIVPCIEGVSYFLFFVVGMILAFSSFNVRFEVPGIKSLVHHFRLSKDNFLISILSWITTSGILVMTERFVASQPLGYYGIFTRICYYIFIAVHQINLSIFPYISERYALSWDDGQRLFKSVGRVFALCVVLLLIGGIVFGNLFFGLFFDARFTSHLNEYMPAYYVLVVRIAFLLANSYIGLQFFVANKNDFIYKNYYVVNTIICIISSLVFVQWWGIVGAAFGACLGEGVMFIFMIGKYFSMSAAISLRRYQEEENSLLK